MLKSLFKISNNYTSNFLIKNYYAKFATFKVQEFTPQDYETLSMLLRQKCPVYNQQMQILTDVKLFDQKNKLIGIYTPPQARKKAYSLKKDIILVNDKSNPAVCKAVDFRNSTLDNFFNQIIIKRNQELINRASSIKNLKLKPSLNINEVKIKARQISQLAKKHSKVRIYMILKNTTMDQGLQKFDLLKSLIQNSCRILQEVDIWNRDQQDQQDQELNQVGDFKTISMVVKSSKNQFMELLEESSKSAPEKAIKNFLKRFYKQQDVDMRDMKQRYQKKTVEKQKQTEDLVGLLSRTQKDQIRQKQLQRIKQIRSQKKQSKIVKTQDQIEKDKKILKLPKQISRKYRNQKQTIKQGQNKIMVDRLKKLISIYDEI